MQNDRGLESQTLCITMCDCFPLLVTFIRLQCCSTSIPIIRGDEPLTKSKSNVVGRELVSHIVSDHEQTVSLASWHCVPRPMRYNYLGGSTFSVSPNASQR